jgi:hypothetical protein
MLYEGPIEEAGRFLDHNQMKIDRIFGVNGQKKDSTGTLEKIDWIMDCSESSDALETIQYAKKFIQEDLMAKEACNWVEIVGEWK